MKILIADFQQKIGKLLKVYLEDGGYTNITLLESITDIYKFIANVEHIESVFDLIIVDYLTFDDPKYNLINFIEKFQNTPIMVITEENDTDSLQNIFSFGAIDYIKKPVTKIELISRVNSCLILRNEIKTRKKLQKELFSISNRMEYLTNTIDTISKSDYLTGLPNRHYFEVLINRIWHEARLDNQDLSFIKANIDNLKIYNDLFGFYKGDKIINVVSEIIKETTDIFDGVVCRLYGGDFIMALPDIDRYEAIDIAETIRYNIEQLNILIKNDSYVTLSMGVTTTIPKLGNNELNSFIDIANDAMQKAKNNGGNKVLYSGHLRTIESCKKSG